jgi:hypothetical protein
MEKFMMNETILSLTGGMVITAIVAICILGAIAFICIACNTQSAAAIKELFFAGFGLIFFLLLLGFGAIALIRYLL